MARVGRAGRADRSAAGVRVTLVVLGIAGVVFASSPAQAVARQTPEPVLAHDNTRAAGRIDRDVVTIRLRAAVGQWEPEGPSGPQLTVDALGEEGGLLTVPAPLIRVAEGMSVAVSIHNELAAPLRVYGLCARDGSACAPVEVEAGSTSSVRFAAGRAGTYHYWATSMGLPFPFREMAGAFVVDPAGVDAGPDRIFVITDTSPPTTFSPCHSSRGMPFCSGGR